MFLTYFRVGKVPLVGIGTLIYEGIFLIVSCGVFAKNRTQDVFKARDSLFWGGVRLLIFFLVLIF